MEMSARAAARPKVRAVQCDYRATEQEIYNALVRATDNTAVLVPEGYHPVTSAPGYTTYYLNVLAGSAQSLANQDDPNATWVKTTYKGVDSRLPLY